jgi:hypothetical protein
VRHPSRRPRRDTQTLPTRVLPTAGNDGGTLMHLYDPTGCLRERRKQEAQASRALNAAIGSAIVIVIVGLGWLITFLVHN